MAFKLKSAAKPDGASKTLVLLGIVVFQCNLKFNGFCEFPLLCSCTLHDSRNGLLQVVSADLTRNRKNLEIEKAELRSNLIMSKLIK